MTTRYGTTGRPLRRTVLVSMAAMLCVACAGTAFAGPELVDLRIVDRDTGRVLRTYAHDGRLYVAGQPGARYGLRVVNHTAARVMVVLSVDGVNIVTGETANYNQNGYVLAPWGSYDLNGWRKSRTEIAAFQFAPLPQSYAARTGRPDDVGVIGMAVFRERRVYRPPVYDAPPVRRDRESESSADAAAGYDRAPPPSAVAKAAPSARNEARAGTSSQNQAPAYGSAGGYAPAPQDEKLGTAHGAREWAVTEDTTFERATRRPQSVRLIEYDTYANLAALGVIPSSPYAYHRPRPFPDNPAEPQFVPDPPDDR